MMVVHRHRHRSFRPVYGVYDLSNCLNHHLGIRCRILLLFIIRARGFRIISWKGCSGSRNFLLLSWILSSWSVSTTIALSHRIYNLSLNLQHIYYPFILLYLSLWKINVQIVPIRLSEQLSCLWMTAIYFLKLQIFWWDLHNNPKHDQLNRSYHSEQMQGVHLPLHTAHPTI